ncbi:MAG TPA: amidohydrolase family protein [Gemmatimonadales bacterium]|nr:amidohydrolase family protein [Gemmatimonadales bacterium]
MIGARTDGRTGARALTGFLAGAMLLLGSAASAHAQTIAITGGTVYPVSGPKIPNGTVIIRDGKVAQVGAGLAVPSGAQVIDARGKWVTPGLIHGGTTLGLVEVGSIDETSENGAAGNENAAFNVAEGLNPAATTIPVARMEGVTAAFVAPTDGLIAGEGVIIGLNGDRIEDLVRVSPAALMMSVGAGGRDAGGGSRAGELAKIRQLFADAQEYDRRRADYGRNAMRPLSAPPADLDVLSQALQGKLLVVVLADRRSDIESALRLAREYHLKMILGGAAEGWMVAPEIAAAGVPVLVQNLRDVPRWDALNARLDNATLLRRAGVNVVLAQNDDGRDRDLRWSAGNAVRNGMSWDDALRAITLAPAQAFNVADRMGSLDAGKIADVVVWSGDPLDFASTAEHVLIAGKEVPLTSRMVELRERYRHLPPPR